MTDPIANARTEPPKEADVAVVFACVAAFEAWLDANAHDVDGVWIKVAKKASGIASITSDEAVDVGLCFGWISGKRLALDDRYYLQRYVPRRPRSTWSQLNKMKVQQLISDHRLRPAGLAEAARAQLDGRW